MSSEIESRGDPANEKNEDQRIAGSLASLRRLARPEGLRKKSREAIRNALDMTENAAAEARLPWWKRRLAIPVPVAAGFIASLILLLYMQVGARSERGKADPFRSEAVENTPRPSSPTSLAEPVRTELTSLHPYERAIYVQGIGFLDTEIGFQFEEEEK